VGVVDYENQLYQQIRASLPLWKRFGLRKSQVIRDNQVALEKLIIERIEYQHNFKLEDIRWDTDHKKRHAEMEDAYKIKQCEEFKRKIQFISSNGIRRMQIDNGFLETLLPRPSEKT